MVLNLEALAGRAAAVPLIAEPIEPGAIEPHGALRPGALVTHPLVNQNRCDESRNGNCEPRRRTRITADTQPGGKEELCGDAEPRAPDACVPSIVLHEPCFTLAQTL